MVLSLKARAVRVLGAAGGEVVISRQVAGADLGFSEGGAGS